MGKRKTGNQRTANPQTDTQVWNAAVKRLYGKKSAMGSGHADRNRLADALPPMGQGQADKHKGQNKGNGMGQNKGSWKGSGKGPSGQARDTGKGVQPGSSPPEWLQDVAEALVKGLGKGTDNNQIEELIQNKRFGTPPPAIQAVYKGTVHAFVENQVDSEDACTEYFLGGALRMRDRLIFRCI